MDPSCSLVLIQLLDNSCYTSVSSLTGIGLSQEHTGSDGKFHANGDLGVIGKDYLKAAFAISLYLRLLFKYYLVPQSPRSC
jgi:hypothetical protein